MEIESNQCQTLACFMLLSTNLPVPIPERDR